jgi:hypothetical protein
MYMHICRRIMACLLMMYSELSEYVQADGSIITLLLKAMYGCVQASRLWCDLLTKILCSRGYVISETDPCVLRRVMDGMIFIILLYVDNLLIFANQAEMDGLQALLMAAFKSIVMEISKDLSYLGMQIVWTAQGFEIGMGHYMEQLVKDWPTSVYRTGPGMKDTFKIDPMSPLLKEWEQNLFHSTVARILYLVKRIRMDALMVTSFLCTRVMKATEEDLSKLECLMGYFKLTKGQKLFVRVTGGGHMQIHAFIDKAFALHHDSKSHSGVINTVGGAVVYVSSGEQGCMTKSPTESELIAYSDKLGLVELFHEFVCFLLGKWLVLRLPRLHLCSIFSYERWWHH